MKKEKKVPQRTCIVTKEKHPKKELIRIVKVVDENIIVDASGKLPGRGANIVKDVEKLKIAFDKGILKRALRLDKNFTKEEKENIIEEFRKVVEEKEFRGEKKKVKIRVKKEEMEKLKVNN